MTRTLLPTMLALATAAAQPVLPPGSDDVVQFASGSVRGIRSTGDNLRYFLAVPYASSTDGNNSFAPPRPRASWDFVMDCNQFGAGCLQTHHNPDVPANTSYDCLNVNIYAPILANGSAPVPVMVFFHGGAYLEGSNQGPFGIYSGAHFASEHNVVVVAANYRLGPFGWLYAPPASPGNLGFMDMIAALQWVQANVAVVGGDPSQVTVFGESAGAMSIGALMTMPAAQGLFHRAIMESNVAGFNYKNTSEAEIYGSTMCGLLNCTITGAPVGSDCNATCLQAADPFAVMDAWNKATGNVGDFIITNLPHILDGLLGTGPIINGPGGLLPAEPLSSIESGNYWAKGMPVLLGTNSNEGETFIYAGVDFELPGFLIPIGYTALLDWNETAAALVNAQPRYNSSAYPDGRTPLSHVVTDYWFRCASERFLAAAHASGANAWAYRYAHVYSNSSIFPTFGLPEICATSVCHASELPFVFHNVPNFTSFTPDEDVLASAMTGYWANFAKTGDPNNSGGTGPRAVKQLRSLSGGAVSAATPWPAWAPSGRTSIVLDTSITTESTTGMCGFWDGIGGYFF